MYAALLRRWEKPLKEGLQMTRGSHSCMLMLGPGLRQLHRPQQCFVVMEEGPCAQGKREIKFRTAGSPVYVVQYMYMSPSKALVQVARDVV
jgi:hypothetical protein